jgi:hypothetical protein
VAQEFCPSLSRSWRNLSPKLELLGMTLII